MAACKYMLLHPYVCNILFTSSKLKGPIYRPEGEVFVNWILHKQGCNNKFISRLSHTFSNYKCWMSAKEYIQYLIVHYTIYLYLWFPWRLASFNGKLTAENQSFRALAFSFAGNVWAIHHMLYVHPTHAIFLEDSMYMQQAYSVSPSIVTTRCPARFELSLAYPVYELAPSPVWTYHKF